MDPNANLAELRHLLELRDNNGDWPHHEANRFGELFEALDEWITSGGFLPEPWIKGRPF
jgi:hypothetical protein